MADIKFGNREVTSIDIGKGKFGPFKILTTLDGKGKQREERLYDRSLQEQVQKPGAYKFGYELDEDSGYPKIVAIEALNGAVASETKENASEPQKPASVPLRSNVNDLRGKLINTCIMSAAQVYQGQGNMDDHAKVTNLSGHFLRWAEKELEK